VILCLLTAFSAVAQQIIATVPVGQRPDAVAANSITNKIYVPSRDFQVTVIDGVTNQTTMVGVGITPIALALNPVTNKIYVVNAIDNTVSVIDGATNDVATVNVGVSPDFVAVNPVTNKIYVSNGCGDDPNCRSLGTVTVIDGQTNQTTTIPTGALPGGAAVNTTTNKIYVANECGADPTCSSGSGTVTIIDGATNQTSTVAAGDTAELIALDSVTNKIYVTNYGSNTVTIIDGATNSTSTINVGTNPIGVAVNPLTNRIYVVNNASNNVSVIDGGTNNVATVPVGQRPLGIAVDQITDEIYVNNETDNTVTMIDGSNNATVTVAVGNHPIALDLDPVTNRVYVANFNDNTVSVLAGGTRPVQFVPIAPCRLVDTRNPDGNFGGPPILGGTSRSFPAPQGGCDIPTSAAAYSLNVTLVPIRDHPVGYLTIWPTGESQPLVSTMNSLDGRTKANAAIVPAGASGAVSVFVTNTADVVIDIDGYFAPPSAQTLQFYPLPPCRVADTRNANFPQGLGAPHLSQGVARDFPVLSADSCNIPPSAQAYSLNFTAIPYPSLGHPLAYLEVWPTDQQPQHPVSTLNNPTATFVANAAIVPTGTDGKITAYASDDTDLAIDINGYFAAPGTGGLSLYPTVPCRVFDTRKVGSGQPFTGTLSPPVDVVDSPCGIPNTAQAYVSNATVVPSPNLSYLTLWPDSQDQPVVSTLNAADGWVTSNMAIVPSVNGKIDAYAAGMTQLILDISSYFAP
jgi:YVTN family beta-propeller protein